MDIKKLNIKTGIILISVLVIGVSIFFFTNNKNVEDKILKNDMEEIIELMNISDTMFFMYEDIVQLPDDAIDNISKNEKKFNETKIETNEVNIIKEDNIDTCNDEKNIETINELIQDKRPISTSNRGESVEKNKRPEVSSKSLNEYVLDIISTYSLEEGDYPYLLNNDFENYNGVTEDIYYKGELILKSNPSGDKASNCTGISFEVFFKAMQKRNQELGISIDDFNGMTQDELYDMALIWFVAKGPKSESNLAIALEKYGLGTRINDLEKVRPGDFIDLSRENNSGHAVVFIDWIRGNDTIIGLKLWSSQGSTNGISYKEEYFNIKDKNGNKYGGVIKDSLNIVRVNPVSEYK